MRKSKEAFTREPDSLAIPQSDISVPGPVLGMQDQLIFEKLISAVSARFINVPLELLDEEIHAAMHEVVDYLKIDRFALLRGFPGKDKWIITHCVSSDGVPSVPVGAELPASINPWAYEKLVIKKEVLSYSNADDLPAEAATDKKTWAEWGIRSNLNIPLVMEDLPFDHVLAFNSIKKEIAWPEELLPRLRLLGEIFVNAIERGRIRKALEERLQFEELLSSLSARFINLPFERIDEEIHSGMKAVLDFFKVDRIGLLQMLPEKKSWIITHYVSAEDVPPIPVGVEFPISGNPWAYDKLFMKQEAVTFSNAEDVPPEADVDKKFWMKYGIRSTLTIPIMIGEAVNYFINISSVASECVWPEEYIPRLRLLGEIFANALERSKARKSLLESENHLSLVTSAADAGLWDMDSNTGRVWVTPKLRDLFEFQPEEDVTFDRFIEKIHPDDREMVRESVRQSIDNQSLLRVEYRVPKLDGGTRWILASGRPDQVTKGPAVRLMGASLDVTSRREMEIRLKESEERLSFAFSATQDGIWDWNMETDEVIYSPRWKSMLGYTDDEIEPHVSAWKRLLHPEDRAMAQEVVQAVLRGEKNYEMEFRMLHKDGHYVNILSRGCPIRREPGGPVVRVVGTHFDLTERKLAEEALRQNEERLRLVMEAISEGVWDWDIPSGKAYFSNRYFGMLGYEPGEVTTSYDAWKELVHPDDLQMVLQSIKEHIKDGKEARAEFRMRKKSGDWCWILSRGMVIERGEDGQAIRMVGTHLDISGRKQMELEAKKSQTLLDKLINSTDDMIWSVNANDFGIMSYNRTLSEYFLHHRGIRLEAGARPEDLFDSEEYIKLWRSFYQQALDKGSFTTDYRVYAKNRILRLKLNAMKYEGVPFGVAVFGQDITEITEKDEKLWEQLEEIKGLKEQLEKENIYLRQEIKTEMGFDKIIGSSEAMQYVLFRSMQVAPTDATVIILGETGVGKGMIANAIHENSSRKDRVMVTVNCAALPANLIESELFGREKGAFTGAHARQAGRFEIADRGTIFLDEIGELPLELQAKLLRVLQDGEFERLGSPRSMKVDVRVIASTSRDLKQEVRNGRFREDLFYRLNTFPVTIPPLRKRDEDIPVLARFFIDKYARKFGRKFDTMKKDTMQRLQSYDWPGNVRELEHVIERSVITSSEPVFDIIDKLENELNPGAEESNQGFETMARDHIIRVLQKTGWKIDGQGGAAAILGLKPSTLRFRIKKLGIKRP